MKKRFSCFAVAVVLLTLTTLWTTACGSTSAEAGTADHPCAPSENSSDICARISVGDKISETFFSSSIV